jgi:hypothetical protein
VSREAQNSKLNKAMNTLINNATNHPTEAQHVQGRSLRNPKTFPQAFGTAMMPSFRQKSFRVVSGLFQRTNTNDNAAATADSKTPLNRSFSFQRGRGLGKLGIEEHIDDSASSHSFVSSYAASSMDAAARGQQIPPSTRQPHRHRRRTKRSAKSTMDDMEHVTKELERMARALGKVEDPDKILLKHLRQKSAHSSAA